MIYFRTVSTLWFVSEGHSNLFCRRHRFLEDVKKRKDVTAKNSIKIPCRHSWCICLEMFRNAAAAAAFFNFPPQRFRDQVVFSGPNVSFSLSWTFDLFSFFFSLPILGSVSAISSNIVRLMKQYPYFLKSTCFKNQKLN